MSNVPLSRRKKSRFEAEHQFYKLRDSITLLMLQDFGFSPEKYAKQIERYKQSHKGASDVDTVVAKWINPKSVTRQRRKLKSYKRLYDKGGIDYESIKQSYKSWMGSYARHMSKKQIKNMKSLYYSLFKEDPRWKKCIRSHSQMVRQLNISG